MSLNQIIYTVLLYGGGLFLLVIAVSYKYSRISSLSKINPQSEQSNPNSLNYHNNHEDDYYDHLRLKYSIQTSNNQFDIEKNTIGNVDSINQINQRNIELKVITENRLKSIPRYKILNSYID